MVDQPGYKSRHWRLTGIRLHAQAKATVGNVPVKHSVATVQVTLYLLVLQLMTRRGPPFR